MVSRAQPTQMTPQQYVSILHCGDLSRKSFFPACGVVPLIAILLLASTWSTCAHGETQLTVDGSQIFQTIDGFGVNANHRSWNNNELQPVLDALIDQGG